MANKNRKPARRATPSHPRQMGAIEAEAAQAQNAIDDLAIPTAALPDGFDTDASARSSDSAGLSRREIAASESIAALAEEGQSYEADFIAGIEDAADAPAAGVPRVPARKEHAL